MGEVGLEVHPLQVARAASHEEGPVRERLARRVADRVTCDGSNDQVLVDERAQITEYID